MTVEEQLKGIILSRYKSIRAFTTANDIPYSTLDSVFKRGLLNAGVGTIIKVFKALNLDVESIATGELESRSMEEKNLPESSANDTERLSQKEVMNFFVDSGVIPRSRDLSEADIRFLTIIIDAVDDWFAE